MDQEQSCQILEFVKDSNIATFKARLSDAKNRMGSYGLVLNLRCAFGHFEIAAASMGVEVVAADTSLAALKYAKRTYGIQGVLADASRPPFRAESFDLICLYDVLEHMTEPLLVLEQAQRLLKPGGKIHIVTPDVKSWSALLMGRHWFHYKRPKHVGYFSPNTLVRALSDSGWQIDHVGAAGRRMSLKTIICKLSVYSQHWSNRLMKWLDGVGSAKFAEFAKLPLPLHLGEMEVWASLPKAHPRNERKKPKPHASDPVTVCPQCFGELQKEELASLRCEGCDARYEICDGIPLLISA